MNTKILPLFEDPSAPDLWENAKAEAGPGDTEKKRITADVAPVHKGAAASRISTDTAPIPIPDMRFRSVRSADFVDPAHGESGG